MIRMTRFAARLNRLGLALLLSTSVGLLAACDTAEERAEKHYQAGLALIEEGDVDRALVEFRNVFKLNGRHMDARLAYARAQRDRGYIQEAYGQYLRLVEQFPENIEGRRALSVMALDSRNWPEVERHVTKAMELAPADLQVQSVNNTMTYFYALRDRDDAQREAAVIKAQALIEEDNTLRNAREIVIDDLVRKQDWYAALAEIDKGLAEDPEALGLYQLRLGVLQQVGDLDGIDAQLRDLMARFPDRRNEFKQTLVQFLVSQQKLDEAEAFLRAEATGADATTEQKLFLLGFLETFRGVDAALAETEELIASGTDDQASFRAIRAKLNFGLGNRDTAIAELEEIVETAARSPETRAIEIDLARMYFVENNAVGARALVEKVLSEDSTQPDAVKLKANWLIDDDQTGDAIVMLRDALGQTPQDADLMTLMARAHEREGSNELKEEMLSLAVQASNNAPAESLRYAAVLVQADKLLAAEGVVIDALRAQPQNIALLSQLGAIYVADEDWGRTDGVIEALENLDTVEATARATELTAQKLAGQEMEGDLTALLEGLANDPNMGRSVQIALLQTRLEKDGPEAAMAYIDELLAETPDDPSLRFVRGGLMATLGREDEAETVFRALVDEDPNRATVWLAYYRLRAQMGDEAGIDAILNEALAALPEDGNLLWIKAGALEAEGDLEGAISIYEGMYARNSNSLIVANNLASLLSTARSDDESLQRAYTIARRLRDSDFAPFQDTYGWIAFRRGDYEEALTYIEPALIGLPNDPRVNFHLASVYAALGRRDEALAQFENVQTLIDPDNPPDFAEQVQAEIERLKSGDSAPAQD